MKKIFYFVLSMAFTNTSYAADLQIDPKILTTIGRDYSVEKVIAARGQLIVQSFGRAKKCYLAYRKEFPYRPTTTSYQITKNMDVLVENDRVLNVDGLKETLSLVSQKLRSDISKSCSVRAYFHLMLKGEVTGAKSFLANPVIVFDAADGVYIQLGSLNKKIQLGSENSVEVLVTSLTEQSWEMAWSKADPAIEGLQFNY